MTPASSPPTSAAPVHPTPGPADDPATSAGDAADGSADRSGLPRVAIVTLGCGRNEVDSDQLAGLLGTRFEVTADATAADVVLVNTCTFIEPAKQESIDTILAAADLKHDDEEEGRTASAAGVVVIGCMAQRYPVELSEALPEADAIVGFAGYPALPGLVDDILGGRAHDRIIGVETSTAPSVLPGRSLPVFGAAPADLPAAPPADPAAADGDADGNPAAPPAAPDGDPAADADGAASTSGATWLAPVPELPGAAPDDAVIDPLALVTAAESPASGPVFPPRRAADGTWAYLKIASGCDRLCTFCAIPSFRGRFRSRGIDELVAEATWLASQGVKELVLVSENTTSWGKDLGSWQGRPGGRSLAPHLLQALADVAGIHRIRLMYLQPAELREDLLEAIAGIPEVADYFDLSLQHVSADVLRRMARSGSPERFGALLARIRELAPDAAIRSNFIVGFPGETDADVARLATFLADHELDFVGLFTYSDEDGTPAVDLPDHVDREIAARRLADMADVANRASDDRARRRIGDRLEVIVEGVDADGAWGRSHREAPESDGEVRLVDGAGGPAAVASGDVVSALVVASDGVDLVATA